MYWPSALAMSIAHPLCRSLALRQEPSRNTPRVREINPGDILVIVDGPVEADGAYGGNSEPTAIR